MQKALVKVSQLIWGILLVVIGWSCLVAPVLASSPFSSTAGNSFINNIGFNSKVEYNEKILAQRLGDIIKVALSFIGVLILVIIIYAGLLWLTAGGNQEQVTKARKWLINAFIGAFIVGLAYAITAAVLFITQNP